MWIEICDYVEISFLYGAFVTDRNVWLAVLRF